MPRGLTFGQAAAIGLPYLTASAAIVHGPGCKVARRFWFWGQMGQWVVRPPASLTASGLG